jgi:hypothetical protein
MVTLFRLRLFTSKQKLPPLNGLNVGKLVKTAQVTRQVSAPPVKREPPRYGVRGSEGQYPLLRQVLALTFVRLRACKLLCSSAHNLHKLTCFGAGKCVFLHAHADDLPQNKPHQSVKTVGSCFYTTVLPLSTLPFYHFLHYRFTTFYATKIPI